MEIINDGQWINGLDSISYTLGQGSYTWGQNVSNRGGIIETRQGFAEVDSIAQRDPRGLGYIEVDGTAWLLAAIGNYIFKLNLNTMGGLQRINGLEFIAYDEPVPPNPAPPIPVNKRMVHFELCVFAQKSVKEGSDYITSDVVPPRFVVIIQDGFSAPQYWDPSATRNQAGKIDEHPDFVDSKPHNTPKGVFMQWAGDRLWVVQGKKVRASNLLNPFQFTEELVTASGGFFYLPDNATGIGVTHDYKALLAFTHFTTSAFQVGLEDRTAWSSTQDFQRVIFPSIGCASHRTIINMYGMTWWMSHDGLVGLDNAMAAYQTTRLETKDLNMIRSKQGINWATKGGCSGSFGNFLFFSVPSGSIWNQHTWVMDQAPMSLLTGTVAPSWCANWTGIRPEQWVTCDVGGQHRCFCISRDLTNQGHQSTIWEAFIGQRMDVPKDGPTRKAKDIGCAFESRFVGLSPSQYCKLRWIELDIAEIVGNVTLHVYYCGRRTSYKKIIDTKLTATVSNTTEEVFNPEDPMPVFVPQYRTIRSVTDTHSIGTDPDSDNPPDFDSEVQTPYQRNKDREFSVLVQWNGQMAVSAVRFAVDPEPDYMEGGEYLVEDKKRTITAEGEGRIWNIAPPDNAPNGQLVSKFLSPTKPRWVEFPSYDSAVPNGIFFVEELFATPTPGDYPSNVYPITVTLTSGTQGIDIYYTRDGSIPHGPPNPHGTHYTPTTKPIINIGNTLKAVGVRAHMNPSRLFEGHYTQSRVADVVFNPPAGGFPPDEFAQDTPDYTGPVAMYNMNEGTDTVVGDSSPHNYDGGANNTTWNPVGKHGKALNFNGTTAYVFIGAPQGLKFHGDWTLSAWVNVSALPPSGQRNFIVGRANGTGGWSIYTDTSGFAVVSVSSANSVFATRKSGIPLTLNTWTHITGRYNATAGSLLMYINGEPSNGALTGVVPHTQTIANTNVTIGRSGNGTHYFHGIIDDVRIYDRAITNVEIGQDTANGVVPPPGPASGFAVTMSTGTPLAEIHYKISASGTPPVTEGNTQYDSGHPPHPHAGDTYQAKAFKDFYLPSTQTHAHYFSEPRCATPTCTPDGGEYPEGDYPKSIRIASATSGSQLRYTINDPEVETGAIKDNGAHVNVSINDTLRVIAQKEGNSDSFVKQATYTKLQQKVSTPELDPNPVIVTGNTHSKHINVETSTTNAQMRWTVTAQNEVDPPRHDHGNLINSSSSVIKLGPNETPPTYIGHWAVRVIAFKDGWIDSDVATCKADWEHEEGGQ